MVKEALRNTIYPIFLDLCSKNIRIVLHFPTPEKDHPSFKCLSHTIPEDAILLNLCESVTRLCIYIGYNSVEQRDGVFLSLLVIV